MQMELIYRRSTYDKDDTLLSLSVNTANGIRLWCNCRSGERRYTSILVALGIAWLDVISMCLMLVSFAFVFYFHVFGVVLL